MTDKAVAGFRNAGWTMSNLPADVRVSVHPLQTADGAAVNGFLFQLAKIGVWKKDLVGVWENSPAPQLDLTGVYWK
mgnify:CR=1 FL=1